MKKPLGFYPPDYIEIPDWFDISDPEGSLIRHMREKVNERLNEVTGELKVNEFINLPDQLQKWTSNYSHRPAPDTTTRTVYPVKN